MFRTARFIIGTGLTGTAVVAVIAGWLTGFFDRLITRGDAMIQSILAFFNQPWGLSQILAGAGTILVPIGIAIAIFFILTDS